MLTTVNAGTITELLDFKQSVNHSMTISDVTQFLDLCYLQLEQTFHHQKVVVRNEATPSNYVSGYFNTK